MIYVDNDNLILYLNYICEFCFKQTESIKRQNIGDMHGVRHICIISKCVYAYLTSFCVKKTQKTKSTQIVEGLS